jgi:dTDP-4-dehydrorhamnose 3,5-epimerase-like enzyme
MSSNTPDSLLWQGLRPEARDLLEMRNYSASPPLAQLSGSGLPISALLRKDDFFEAWIPGVEIVPRTVYQQPGRGYFAEFVRQHEGVPAKLSYWPQQWATATMFAGSVKGFHIHPPSIPADFAPEAWFRRLFVEEPENMALRSYAKEQWDLMFFTRGICEMILVDERAGLERRIMRFRIDGDNRPGPNNAGVVIPPGVAHALRCMSSEDLVMVYGTSTPFDPKYEGRIGSAVENSILPEDWQAYLSGKMTSQVL